MAYVIIEEISTIMRNASKFIENLKRELWPGYTELQAIQDLIRAWATLRISNRDVTIPGLVKYLELGLLPAVIGMLKERARAAMFVPPMFATGDQLTIEPIWRPKIFGLNNWEWDLSGKSAGDTVDYLPRTSGTTVSVTREREVYVFTDFMEASDDLVVGELHGYIDENRIYPIDIRKDIEFTDIHITQIPAPLIADSSIDLNGTVDYPGVSYLMPGGIHILVGTPKM